MSESGLMEVAAAARIPISCISFSFARVRLFFSRVVAVASIESSNYRSSVIFNVNEDFYPFGYRQE